MGLICFYILIAKLVYDAIARYISEKKVEQWERQGLIGKPKITNK